MSTKHTPGPWKRHQYGVYSEGKTVAMTFGDELTPLAVDEGQHEANAALIAAAPDLLKVAEDMVSLLCTCDCNDWATLEEQDAHCHCDDRYGYLKNARAAIRKTVVK